MIPRNIASEPQFNKKSVRMIDSLVLRILIPTLTLAGEWLLKSGIQSPNGGVARYYRSDLERNQPISTEITGYAVSAFVYLFEKTGQPIFADRARLAADFLTDQAWDKELQTFPFEFPGRPPAYFFDCGIIVRGLLAAWRMSCDERYLEAAVAGGNSMLRDFAARDDFHPILELPSKQPATRDARWSRSSGCYQLKAAMAWGELAEVTENIKFRRAFDRMLEFAIATHDDFLPGSEDENRVMDRLHAYSYFLEALVSYGHDVSEGVGRVAAYLGKIGPRFVRSDVYAQLLRVRLLSEVGLESAAAEAEELEKFQARAGVADPRIAGGFYFGRKGGAFLPYINPVSTVFAMQALEMWREHQAGRLERDCRIVI
jgi:hypothetical protein